MTLIYHKPGRNPATHALVIGVGDYPHLDGGNRPVPRVSRWGLGQPSSPPLSARKIADFLVEELVNPEAPLGSVELLLSPSGSYRPPSGGERTSVDPATMGNIAAAAGDWKSRCDRHENNVALFFFCGHGIGRRHLYLLAEDFGDPDYGNPFRNAFDLEKTAEGLGSECKAKVQCFFPDACRSLPSSLSIQPDCSGLFAIKPNLRLAEDAPIFFATLTNDPAYGNAKDGTAYTKSVLQGFRGTGSIYRNGKWQVTTGRLGEAISRAMEAEAELRKKTADGREGASAPQKPADGGNGTNTSVLNVLPGRPQVPVRIYLEPEEVSGQVELSVTSRTSPANRHSRGPNGDVWRLTLEKGEYSGDVTYLSEPPKKGAPRELPVDPPETVDTWEL